MLYAQLISVTKIQQFSWTLGLILIIWDNLGWLAGMGRGRKKEREGGEREEGLPLREFEVREVMRQDGWSATEGENNGE